MSRDQLPHVVELGLAQHGRELGLDPEQPRKAACFSTQLAGAAACASCELEADARAAASSATRPRAGSAGRNDSAASNAGYSFIGVESSSASQSWASTRPASVRR